MDIELFQKEKFLQLVLNNIPSFVFWKDRESVYLGCNKNFANYAGLKNPNDIYGKTDYDLPWSKEEADFFRKIDTEVMDSALPQINFEEPQTISDGSIRWLRTSKIPLFNEAGIVIGILGSYEDITERKSMELELIERNEKLQLLNTKLEAVNIDLEQFAYATSHDLQEPLRMIGGFTGLLQKNYEDSLDNIGKEYLNFIREGTERMSTLIRQILSYSKLEKVEGKYEEVDLQLIVDACLQEFENYVLSKNGEVQINLPTSKVTCQSARIKMLFNNLIINGLKFNESKKPIVKIDYKEKEEEWYFTISDNGIGIEENYKDYVFKPFKRLNNREKFTGNGVGLSICKRITKIHGGKIWYTQNAPHGTVFHFTISKNIGSN